MSILIDGHIHIHSTVDPDRLFDAAWKNFNSVQKELFSDADHCSFVLLLAEGKTSNAFSELYRKSDTAPEEQQGEWKLLSTAEENSILAVQQTKQIIIIAGRQLITLENLELLSLFSTQTYPDKKYSLNELATLVTDEGGVPLLAWGVGKWLGKRGKIIQNFLQHPPVPRFFVGDNGNRPVFWPYPKLLAQSEHQGILSLAGSDPLPISNHDQRAGSYGSALDRGTLESEKPAAELRQLLCSAKALIPFGKRAGCLQFFKDQIQVNLQKRFAPNK